MVRFFMRGKGGDGSREAARDAAREVADKVRRLLDLDEEATVSVTEIACGDPACGGAETVILVMRAGRRTEAAKLLKPLSTVTEEELAEALVPLRAVG
ncbi:hypothetical protein [Aquabacter cavernae]|uniref:hypothetical protein n=1 Tax=Aquabacter cavernae TaxID=2496029 RepID=UPI000F8C9010|nr:hypothetical protein [Aquabacter cavernae]